MKQTLFDCPDWLACLVRQKGCVVSFSQIMDWALNDPKNGAYAKGKLSIGINGDFVTSPSLGPIFSEILSAQIAEWIQDLDQNSSNKKPISLVDIGPGEGHLTFYLISALRKYHPLLLSKIEFILVELNNGMIKLQKKMLAPLCDQIPIKWMSIDDLRDAPVYGIIIANELLDAFPVDRVVWSNNSLCEQGVELVTKNKRNYLRYINLKISSSLETSINKVSKEMDFKIPPINVSEGWNSEWHSSIKPWFNSIDACIASGYLLIIDYALEAFRYYQNSRNNGTIISYSNQKSNINILEGIGSNDITSHICLETLYYEAKKNNWNFIGQRKQGLALLALGLSSKLSMLHNLPDSEIAEALNKREAILRLVDPSLLGDFRWILFEKKLPSANFSTSMFLLEPNN